ncbi:unnamed protein product, partial [Ectocarpus sp. 12 AP-2014]
MPRARSTKRGGGRIMVAAAVGDGGGAAVPRSGEGGGVSAEGANRERTSRDRLPAAGTTSSTPSPESHTPAAAAAPAATAATYARLAQRSSTRLALQRSTFSPSPSAAANPSSVRRPHRSTRVNRLAEKGAAATPACGGGLAGGRQVATAVSVAVPKRASRRLSGGEALVSMRDANDNLDRVVLLRKRKSAGGAGAVTSAGVAAKIHRATGQQQQRQQQAGQNPFGPSNAVDSNTNPNPNPTPGVPGGFDTSNDAGAAAGTSARAAGADASADASADAGAASDNIAPGPKPGAARKTLSTNLSWPPSRLASVTTACVPTAALDDLHTSSSLGTCAAANSASATASRTRAAGSGDRAGRVLRTTAPAAPLSTAVVPDSGTAGRRRDAETGLLVKGGAFTAAGGADTLGAIPAAPNGQQRAEARRQVLPPAQQQQQQHSGQEKEGGVAERVGAGVVATPTVGTTGTTAIKLQPMSAIVAAAAAAATAALAARAAAATAAAAAADVASVGSGESKALRSTAQAAAAAGDSGGPVRADFTGWHSWPKTRQGSRPEVGGIEDASGKVDMNGSGAGLPLLQASPYPSSEGGAGEKNGGESSDDGTGGGGSSGTKDEEGRRLEKKQEPADPKQKVRAQTPPEQEVPEPAAPKPEANKEQLPRKQHKPLQQQPTTPEPPPQKASTPAPSNLKAPKRKDPRREPLKWNGTASGVGRASGRSGSGRTLRKTTANATRSRSKPVAAGGSAASDSAAIPPTGVRGGKPGRGFPIGAPRRAQRQAAATAAAAAAMRPGRSRTATGAAAGAAATRANARNPERSPSSEKVAVGSCAASTRGKRKRQGGDGGVALPSKTPRRPGRHATVSGVAAVAVSAAAAVLHPGTATTPLQMPEKMRPSSGRGSCGGGGRGGKADEDRSGESSGSIPNVESTELEDNSGGGGKACGDRNGQGSARVSMVKGTDVGDESVGAGAGGKSDDDRTGEGSRIVSTVEGKDPGDDPGGGGNGGLPAVVGRGSAPVAPAAVGGTSYAGSARQVNNTPGGGKAGRARRNKKKNKKGAVGSPPNAAAEVRFLKSKEAHAVPLTPTPRYYLPADQGGPIIEDAAGVPASEQGDGIGGGRRFRPALSEGGADVVWDRRRFNLTAPAKVGGGGGRGGCCCCVGAAVDEATTEEAGCLSADSSPETAGSPPHGSDGGDGGHDKGKGKDPPPPRDSTPRARKKKRTLTLREKQDDIFETLVNSSRQKDLITPQEYGHAGGYFGDREQPFKVVVHPHVHFVADAHAYMMEKNEVIGWLGGWYDEEKKVLYVQTAVPCREDQELSGGARGMTEVSMCQASSFHTSEAIRGRRLQLVGWYHSHPKFVNDPSPIDVENHQMFQKDENGEGSSGAWIGLIVGRKTSPSDFRWFRNAHVERVMRDENGELVHTETVLCPMLLRTHLASSVVSPAAAAVAAAAIASASASTPEEETAARIETPTSETGAAALATVGATVGGGEAAAGTGAASFNTAPLRNTEGAQTPRAECLASHSAGHLEVCRDRRLCASGGWEEAGVLAGGTGERADGGGGDGAVDV